jgi:hypothetical protein
MEAGLAYQVWSMEDQVSIMLELEAKSAGRTRSKSDIAVIIVSDNKCESRTHYLRAFPSIIRHLRTV